MRRELPNKIHIPSAGQPDLRTRAGELVSVLAIKRIAVYFTHICHGLYCIRIHTHVTPALADNPEAEPRWLYLPLPPASNQ